MKKLCTVSIAALLATSGATVFAQTAPGSNVKMSKAECQSIWGRADAAGGGSLTSAQAQGFVTNFNKVDTNGDGKLTSAEFLAGCQKGLVHDSASSGAGEGASGSSSSGQSPPAKNY